MRKFRIKCLVTFSTILLSAGASAHSGGTNQYGCHHDRKNGGYHCHKGNYKGMSFGSKEEAEMFFADQAKNGTSSESTKKPASVDETTAAHH